MEESEILNLSPSPEKFGVISGGAFLHCNMGTKADLNMVLQEPRCFCRPEGVRADEGVRDGARLGTHHRLPSEEGAVLKRRREGEGGAERMRQKADRAKRSRGGKGGDAGPREPYTHPLLGSFRQITGTPK